MDSETLPGALQDTASRGREVAVRSLVVGGVVLLVGVVGGPLGSSLWNQSESQQWLLRALSFAAPFLMTVGAVLLGLGVWGLLGGARVGRSGVASRRLLIVGGASVAGYVLIQEILLLPYLFASAGDSPKWVIAWGVILFPISNILYYAGSTLLALGLWARWSAARLSQGVPESE